MKQKALIDEYEALRTQLKQIEGKYAYDNYYQLILTMIRD